MFTFHNGQLVVIVEPPHCGSTSIRAAFGDVCWDWQPRHLRSDELRDRFGKLQWMSALTICLARDPVDRACRQLGILKTCSRSHRELVKTMWLSDVDVARKYTSQRVYGTWCRTFVLIDCAEEGLRRNGIRVTVPHLNRAKPEHRLDPDQLPGWSYDKIRQDCDYLGCQCSLDCQGGQQHVNSGTTEK